MTKDEFQRKYDNYEVRSREDAAMQATLINAVLDEGSVVVQAFPGRGGGQTYCLMLPEAAAMIRQLGIV